MTESNKFDKVDAEPEITSEITSPRVRIKRRNRKRRDVAVLITVIVLVVGSIAFVFSPLCRFGSVQVSGNKKMSVEEICRVAQIDLPLNIFRVKTGDIESKLKKDLRIASVVADRKLWPPTLVVRITENAIMAYAVSSYGVVSLDKNGMVIAAQKVFDSYDAPLLSGVALTDEYVGEVSKNKAVVEATGFLAKIDDITLDHVAEINIANPQEVFLLMDNGIFVRLGALDRQEEKALHLKQMTKEIAEKNFAISQIDLKFEPPTMRVKK